MKTSSIDQLSKEEDILSSVRAIVQKHSPTRGAAGTSAGSFNDPALLFQHTGKQCLEVVMGNTLDLTDELYRHYPLLVSEFPQNSTRWGEQDPRCTQDRLLELLRW